MRTLVTSDLHFTDRPEDDYRWDLFPWLAKQCVKYKVDRLYILGDLTDRKDNHSSVLVNKIVTNVLALSELVEELVILKGNHDYIEPSQPFFGFLDNFTRIRYVTDFLYSDAYFIANTRSPDEFNDKLEKCIKRHLGIFIHQTFNGAEASNGHRLKGFTTANLKPYHPIYSGDIHVPQLCGPVVYVGAPYRIRFNDDFGPRVLLLEDGAIYQELVLDTVKKHTLKITSIADLKTATVQAQDQVKIVVQQDTLDIETWKAMQQEIQDWAKKKKVKLCGCSVSVEQGELEHIGDIIRNKMDYDGVFEAYCRRESLGTSVIHTGRTFMRKAK